MKFYICLLIFIVESVFCCEIREGNNIGSDADCSSGEVEVESESCDNEISNEVTTKIHESEEKQAHEQDKRRSKKHEDKQNYVQRHHNIDGKLSSDVFDERLTNSTTSLEDNQTVVFVTHTSNYFQDYNVTRTPVNNVTTIRPTTWSHQGNMSQEESDESQSTLIDYPFSVSIQKKGAHYASGALLHKLWIITSAGEFYNVRESLKLYRARLGSVDCKRGGILVPLKKIEIHPYYLHGKPNFDVALIRMAAPVNFSNVIRPIAVSHMKGKVLSAKFMTTYWPRILVKGRTLPQAASERVLYNSMRVSTQKLVSADKCTRVLQDLGEELHESSLCLKPVVTHHSICMPDPGAPVVAEDGLWGITSSWISPSCPHFAAPTIFTRLSSVSLRSWLDTHLHDIL
ncbi:hypodermin-A-like [Anticarsia gemmatalis]|uniref:hypodermin-A-like n=1 Tax=Anticarsia gemmatalis TaxID=129554 RepID=UPI003F76E08B